MTGTLAGLVVAALGLVAAAWIGRQERSGWTRALLGGVTGVAGVGGLTLAGRGDMGLVQFIGAMLMYGAAVAAVATVAGRNRR